MKRGNKIVIFLYSLIFLSLPLMAENKISTTPLVNLKDLKPSFEEIEDTNNDSVTSEIILGKKKIYPKNNLPNAKFIGLDKITAKTTEISINIGETKKFGPLEIKVLRCGKVNSKNMNSKVAYLQVKDLTENENEKVFIFNGWTFSSDPTIAPFDHAVYDLQLVTCSKV
tara:strand:+ start:41 stop:547 length:507 start_codon:yes stop_codon:yes gene_type:complete